MKPGVWRGKLCLKAVHYIYILLETKNKYQVCIYILTLSSTYILTDVCKHMYHTFVVMNDY